MWQQALELWERLPQAHLEPDLITYNANLGMRGQQGRHVWMMEHDSRNKEQANESEM